MADEYAMLILDLFERAAQEPAAVSGVAIASAFGAVESFMRIDK